MKNKRLILAEFGYDFGKSKNDIEEEVWKIFAEDDEIYAAVRQRLNQKWKGDK